MTHIKRMYYIINSIWRRKRHKYVTNQRNVKNLAERTSTYARSRAAKLVPRLNRLQFVFKGRNPVVVVQSGVRLIEVIVNRN